MQVIADVCRSYMKRFALLCFLCLNVINTAAGETVVKPPEPFGAVPSARQAAWHKMEFYGFLSFTVNTFTDKEWGYGDESPTVFNPTQLDARQWARVARDTGMTGLVLTAKHHDGFCLWPSKYTEHSVKHSPWKNGQGDVVKDLAEACQEFNLKLGIYLSPWDRNHAGYGTPAYVDYYRKQLEELLTQYGQVFEVWHDGANGGDGYYGGARETRNIDRKTYYDFPRIWKLVRKLQPGAVIFSDAGPDIRWIGNESGYAPDTCWARVNPEGTYPGLADLQRLANGDPGGSVWRPGEVDVSIRKGWFFHEKEKPKSLTHLVNIYYDSVGKGCCLILNTPPDKRGLIPEEDVARLREFRSVLDQTFKTDLAKGKSAIASNTRGQADAFAASKVTDGDRDSYWATDDEVRKAKLTIDLGAPTRFNRIRLQEYIQLGQRVAAFTIHAHDKNGWHKLAEGTTIGARRFLRVSTVEADQVRLGITDSLACPTISTFELYLATTEPAPELPAEVQAKRAAVRKERKRIEALLPGFIESLALPGKPFGRFKFHKAQQQPWMLYASQQMLSLAVRHGYWDSLDETRKKEWVDLLLSTQDPETGLFMCPVVTGRPMAYYRSITLKLAKRLDSIDVKPRYALPEAKNVCPDLKTLPSALESLPWGTQAYGAGSQAGHWAMTRLNELKDKGEPIHKDPYVMTIVDFLESIQNPKTGFWGSSPSLEDGMNGLLKTLSVYQTLGRLLPRAKKVIDSVLAVQRPDGSFGDACSPWNAMELLTFLHAQTLHRQIDIQKAGLRLADTLSSRRQPDGLYSAAQSGCLTEHAGVRLCDKAMPIGDIQGTSQTLSILKMIESLFDAS